MSVTWNGPTEGQSVQLLFSYIKIGAAGSEQYKIVKADILPVSPVVSQNWKSLFVEFRLVPTDIIMNAPPPPKINAYLPNDFLYPFYVAA